MMTLVEWCDEFKIGIEEVDFEHQELIELINELYAETKKEDSATAIMDCLEEIFAKISSHFALEEKVMKDLQYDEYEDHKEDHELLLDSIMDIMDEYADYTRLDEEEFSGRLNDWFVRHFSTKDARMHRFLNH